MTEAPGTYTTDALVARLLCAAQGEPKGPVPEPAMAGLLRKAADEIERLRAALTEVKAAHDVCAEMVLLPDDLMARIARLLVNQTEP